MQRDPELEYLTAADLAQIKAYLLTDWLQDRLGRIGSTDQWVRAMVTIGLGLAKTFSAMNAKAPVGASAGPSSPVVITNGVSAGVSRPVLEALLDDFVSSQLLPMQICGERCGRCDAALINVATLLEDGPRWVVSPEGSRAAPEEPESLDRARLRRRCQLVGCPGEPAAKA